MYILGIHTGHDAAACVFHDRQLIAYCKEERLTRVKNDGGRFDLQCVDAVTSITGISKSQLSAVCFTRMHFPAYCYTRSSTPVRDLKRRLLGRDRDKNLAKQMRDHQTSSESALLHYGRLRNHLGLLTSTDVHFTNHHRSHVLSSLMYFPWKSDVLLVSCDGGGDYAHYSAYRLQDETLSCLWGGDETLVTAPQNPAASIGLAYAMMTRLAGFVPNRHEGKLTGLAAYGKPEAADQILDIYRITEDGRITSELEGLKALQQRLTDISAELSREDLSASIQVATETLVIGWIKQLLRLYPSRRIALSGGVFSNVRLNQRVAELPGIEEVFVFPAMGDEGLPVGNCVDHLIKRYGLRGLNRQRLPGAYLGKPYRAQDLVEAARKNGFDVRSTDRPANECARLLAEGGVGAIFQGAAEMGPRALGARSILASPARREVNDSINKRLQRTEFMPFAPYVLAEDASDVFTLDERNRYACRFMTMTTAVKDQWKDKIPAVVHVDGTARPQIIERHENWLYYDILNEFKLLTGIPCLVNTSFNAHEEPIINTPEEALSALAADRVDFLVCEAGLIFRR